MIDHPYDVASMAIYISPKDAAAVKAQALGLRLLAEPDAHGEQLLRNDPGHQWFLYCLDAIARAS